MMGGCGTGMFCATTAVDAINDEKTSKYKDIYRLCGMSSGEWLKKPRIVASGRRVSDCTFAGLSDTAMLPELHRSTLRCYCGLIAGNSVLEQYPGIGNG